MTMTVRQLQAFVRLSERRKRREAREFLHLSTMAARGEAKALKRTDESLAKDGGSSSS